jgi:hypothetical protein
MTAPSERVRSSQRQKSPEANVSSSPLNSGLSFNLSLKSLYSIVYHQSGYEPLPSILHRMTLFEFNLWITVEMIGLVAKKELDKAMAESVDFPPLLKYEKQSVDDDTAGPARH